LPPAMSTLNYPALIFVQWIRRFWLGHCLREPSSPKMGATSYLRIAQVRHVRRWQIPQHNKRESQAKTLGKPRIVVQQINRWPYALACAADFCSGVRLSSTLCASGL
jgi:hypothetical protein